ncbi:COG4223 family protein [Primorskyibacter flagellatus]|uniref:Mitochondrial inner membrane protein n=1 Tax=Primorskyibacter flagellatus TaxID=1387277 RepID=A0A1W2BW49_9RHOB|nr:hypothetical protein [Primorskyibacter flagellatus]SMC77217.1 hypothetical protein SAMN06295998_10542 [Primorskyibacter flagellatus]
MADDEKSGGSDKINKSSDVDEIKDAAVVEDASTGSEPPVDEDLAEGASAVEAVPGDEAADAAELTDAEVVEGDDGVAAVEAVPDADEDLGEVELTDNDFDRSEGAFDEDPLEEPDDTYDPTPFEAPEPPQAEGFAGASSQAGPATDTSYADTSAPVPQVTQTIVKKAGFLPLLLGGVAAAIIGFVAARYVVPDGWPFPGVQTAEDPFVVDTLATLEAHGAAIADLDTRTAAVEQSVSGIDVDALSSQASDAAATANDASQRLDGLTGNVEALDGRLTALEKRPVEESVSPEAIEAYERELDAMRAAIQTQREEIESMLADATEMEESANQTAQLTQARAALAQISSALTDGTPFADAAAQLRQSTGSIPEALSSVADEGVATQAELADQFPGASRAALSAARNAGAADEGGGRFSSFLREQLGARSVVPKEGNDADAILSRAEAAQRDGDLDAALTEIEALPDPARDALSVWTARAQARRDALAALAAASQELNTQ